MPTRLNRFYKDVNNIVEKAKFDEDFDNLEEFSVVLYSQIDPPELNFRQAPIEEAFRTRVEFILFQNKLRSYHLIEGIINELNNSNIPAVIPLIRAFWELVAQLGYIFWQLHSHVDFEYLLNDPLMRISLGNRNDGTGPFAIGNVTSINILTMVEKAQRAWLFIQEDSQDDNSGLVEDEVDITHLYADLSNQSHPNYISNMFYSSVGPDGIVQTLQDAGKDMESIKPLVYGFYMDPLMVGIGLYHLFLGRIYSDSRMRIGDE